MKNRDIITLCNGGLLVAVAHSLPTEHFYKWHRFRRDVDKANRALGAEQIALLRECGIDRKIAEASPEAIARFEQANGALLEEDAGVSVKARIPFEFYKGVYDENRTEKGDIFADAAVEAIVLDHLFMEPEEAGEGENDA